MQTRRYLPQILHRFQFQLLLMLQVVRNVIGMHFMNPVPIAKLVEIINGDKTSTDTNAKAVAG